METTLNIGDKFKITQFYGKRVMTVESIDASGDYRCTDEVGDVFFFSTKNLEGYAKFNQFHIIERAKLDKKVLKRAVALTIANNILTQDERSGAKKFTATMKAAEMLESVDFDFDGVRLTFVSPDSGKQRIVTVAGCSDLCDCRNTYSYHRAAFDILTQYAALTSNVIAFPVPTCPGVNDYKCGEAIYDCGYCSDCLRFVEDATREMEVAA